MRNETAIKFIRNNKRSLFIVGVFIVLFIVGLLVFKDYGIGSDELINRNFGHYSYLTATSYFDHNPVLDCPEFTCNHSYIGQERIHGPAFEIILAALEKSLYLFDSRSIYLMRHLFTFVLFFVSLIFFYGIVQLYFKNWKISILGVLFLFLSPRIFADSFYNSVDIGALATFIIATYTLFKFQERKTYLWAILNGIACAFAFDVRVTAIIVIFLTVFFVMRDFFLSKNQIERKNILLTCICFCASTIVFSILFWPYLWDNPLKIIAAVHDTSLFKIPYFNLFYGKEVDANQISWYFNPVWIAITTPPIYLISFIIGLFVVIWKIIKKRFSFIMNTYDITFLSWFFLPLILGILLKTSFYNGWRHLFFIYPALILISLIGIRWLMLIFIQLYQHKIKHMTSIVYALLIFVVLYNAYGMFKIHPYEYVYFNMFAPPMKTICSGFDKDYANRAYKQAFEYILSIDQKPSVGVTLSDNNGTDNARILTDAQNQRLIVTDYWHSDYMLYNNPYPGHCDTKDPRTISTISVNGMPILNIVKLR